MVSSSVRVGGTKKKFAVPLRMQGLLHIGSYFRCSYLELELVSIRENPFAPARWGKLEGQRHITV